MSSTWASGFAGGGSSGQQSAFQTPVLTPLQASALRKRIAAASLATQTTGSGKTHAGGLTGHLEDLASHVGLGGVFGSKADQALNEIASAFIMSPIAIWDLNRAAYHDVLHPAQIAPDLSYAGKLIAKQTYSDIRHPLRHPGNTILDAFALASLGAGTSARVASGLNAVRVATGAERAALLDRTAQIGSRLSRATSLDPISPVAKLVRRARLKRQVQLGLTGADGNLVVSPGINSEQVTSAHQAAAQEAQRLAETVPYHNYRVDVAGMGNVPLGRTIEEQAGMKTLHAWDDYEVKAVGGASPKGPLTVASFKDGAPTGIFATRTRQATKGEWKDAYGTHPGKSEPVWVVYDLSQAAPHVIQGKVAQDYAALKTKLAEGRAQGIRYATDRTQAEDWITRGIEDPQNVQVLSQEEADLLSYAGDGTQKGNLGELARVRNSEVKAVMQHLSAERDNIASGNLTRDENGTIVDVGPEKLQMMGAYVGDPVQKLIERQRAGAAMGPVATNAVEDYLPIVEAAKAEVKATPKRPTSQGPATGGGGPGGFNIGGLFPGQGLGVEAAPMVGPKVAAAAKAAETKARVAAKGPRLRPGAKQPAKAKSVVEELKGTGESYAKLTRAIESGAAQAHVARLVARGDPESLAAAARLQAVMDKVAGGRYGETTRTTPLEAAPAARKAAAKAPAANKAAARVKIHKPEPPLPGRAHPKPKTIGDMDKAKLETLRGREAKWTRTPGEDKPTQTLKDYTIRTVGKGKVVVYKSPRASAKTVEERKYGKPLQTFTKVSEAKSFVEREATPKTAAPKLPLKPHGRQNVRQKIENTPKGSAVVTYLPKGEKTRVTIAIPASEIEAANGDVAAAFAKSHPRDSPTMLFKDWGKAESEHSKMMARAKTEKRPASTEAWHYDENGILQPRDSWRYTEEELAAKREAYKTGDAEAAAMGPSGDKQYASAQDLRAARQDAINAAKGRTSAPRPGTKAYNAMRLKQIEESSVTTTRLTLADGTVVSEVHKGAIPRNWKSRLLQKLPANADRVDGKFTQVKGEGSRAIRQSQTARTMTEDEKAAAAARRPTKEQVKAKPAYHKITFVSADGYAVAKPLKGHGTKDRVLDQSGAVVQSKMAGDEEGAIYNRVMQEQRNMATQAERDRLAAKPASTLTPEEQRSLTRSYDDNLHPALRELGLSQDTPRGYGVEPRKLKQLGLTKVQSEDLSRVVYPGVRNIHQRFAAGELTKKQLMTETLAFLKRVGVEQMGLDEKAAGNTANEIWYSMLKARGEGPDWMVKGGSPPTASQMSRVFIKAFLQKPERPYLPLETEQISVDPQGIFKSTAVSTDKYQLSHNPVLRMATRVTYGALKAVDIPEAKGGRGNFANRALRRKIAFENRESKRILDMFKAAGLDEDVRRAQAETEARAKSLNPKNPIALTMDTMNTAAIIGALFLKPAYISANLLGQMMFVLADHSLNPANIYKSMRLQRRYYYGARKGASELERGEMKRRVTLIRAGMGEMGTASLIGGIEVKGGLSPLLTRAHHRMANFYGKILDTPFRDNAFFHEAQRQGFTTPKAIDLLLEAQEGTPLERKRLEIFRAANRNMVDYGRMSKVEQDVIKRIVFFYPWMKGATIYGGRFAAEHPAQLLALSASAGVVKARSDKELGMLPSYLEGVMKVGERVVPGLGNQPTVMNPMAISTLGTAGQAIQMAKALVTGKSRQSDLLANTLTPAASALLAITTHVDPFTGQQIPPDSASALSIAGNVLWKMPAPVRLLNQLQKADEIKKGNLQAKDILLPNTRSEAFGRWLGPGFGAVVGHPLADYTLNTREARSRAASEARAFTSKADSKIALYKDYRQQVKLEAKRLGVTIPPPFDTALALKAQREAAIAVWAAKNNVSRPNSIQRLEADMSLLVRMKKVSDKDAKEILLGYAQQGQNRVDSFRRDLGEMYFGSTILSAYRKALTDRGATLPQF
jgi:hypothetical protein